MKKSLSDSIRTLANELKLKFKQSFKFPAFSVPELMVVGGTIGTLSILVLGVANKEITTQMMNTQKVLFNNDIAVALAEMQADGKLAGHANQESFNKALSEYYYLEDISSNESKISKSFAPSYKDENGKEFDASKYKNKAITSSGISFAYTYNTSCSPKYQFAQDGANHKSGNNYNYAAKNEALSCIEGFYDINGAKGPNQIGKDVMPISEFKKDCLNEDGTISNFIPNAYGNCPNDANKNKEDTLFAAAYVCSKTDLNCKATGNFELDRKNCECVCRISCPIGKELNAETCSCSSDKCENEIEAKMCTSDNKYVDCEASRKACTCIPKNPNAPKLCEDGGGVWDTGLCRCTCPNDKQEEIAKKFNHLAEADPNNFCRAKCIAFRDEDEFDAVVKQNAQNAGVSSGDDLNKVAEITGRSDRPENWCFVCASSQDNSITYVKKTSENSNGKGGYCSMGCKALTDAEKASYNSEYFEFVPYNPNDESNSCKWRCINSTSKGVVKLASQLNSDANYTTPVIKNDSTSIENVKGSVANRSDLANYRGAQDWYFTGAAVGKAKAEYPTEIGWSEYHNITINNSPYKIFAHGRCYHGCSESYNAFSSGNENYTKFAGFLRYAAPFDTNKYPYAFGWGNKSANDYKIKYSANTTTCTIEAEGFDYGAPPATYLELHCTAVQDGAGTKTYSQICYAGNMNFASIDNSSLIIPNPNLDIEAPASSHFGKQVVDNNYWKQLKIGVSVSWIVWADPLALNISDNEGKLNDNPSTEASTTVNFPLSYKDGNYTNESIKWIKNQNPADKLKPAYQFVVNKAFKDTNAKNVGNMFSDQRAADGKQYASGFEQLQAQLDKNNDNIITRDEMTGENELFIWNAKFKKENGKNVPDYSQSTYTSLADFVLDINTYQTVKTDAAGNAAQDENSVYNVQGNYRKLIELKDQHNKSIKPSCQATNTCVKYIGYIDDNFSNKELLAFVNKLETDNKAKAEIWQQITNQGNLLGEDEYSYVYYYHLWKTEGKPEPYSTELTKINNPELKAEENTTLPEKGISALEADKLPAVLSKAIGSEDVKIYKDDKEKDTYYAVKVTGTSITKYTVKNEPVVSNESNDDNVSTTETTNETTQEEPQTTEPTEPTEPQQAPQETPQQITQQTTQTITTQEVKLLPKTASEVTDLATVPDEIKEAVQNDKNAKLYKENDDTYYVVKTTTSATEYTVKGYSSGDKTTISKYFFYDANKWYKVVKAKVTDIVFKVSR